jgi:predicted RNA-binding Zn-ribbon protein involved in translation (DUF1610 family)
MGDTVITMDDGGRFYPSSSTDSVQCSSCDNVVDTPSEVASYPDGDCPQCGNAWTAEAKRHTSITVSMPEAINGGTG